MSDPRNQWYRVPEVWLILILLGATVLGSVALVGTAFAHRDELLPAGPSIASPLPPTTAAPPAPPATP
jgi:hypothetical protein